MTTTHTADDNACTTLFLPHRLESVREARSSLSGDLTTAGLSQALVDDAAIVISELVANACEHGQPNADDAFEVSWCVFESLLRISVMDGGHAPALRPGPLDTDSLRGRGLQMVDTICDRWSTDSHNGTRVTAELFL